MNRLTPVSTDDVERLQDRIAELEQAYNELADVVEDHLNE